jgi:hypothetical protein
VQDCARELSPEIRHRSLKETEQLQRCFPVENPSEMPVLYDRLRPSVEMALICKAYSVDAGRV